MEFKPEDNVHGGVVEETSFAVLFPQYRERYIKEIFPLVKKALKPFKIDAELDLVEGSMKVSTTRQSWDPYKIVKARDLIKLLARSVPFQQAQKVLEDDRMFAEVIKIGGLVRNKEKFVKRRQRLIGPNGQTLKALELLTNCYIMVQGNTVCTMGYFREIKTVLRVVVDCMRNVHPIYSIKELMIRKELAKNPDLKDEIWDRFLPQFKKQNVKRKKIAADKRKKKKEYTPFPPEQLLRKEDIAMMSGEYFLGDKEKDELKNKKKREEKLARKAEKMEAKAREFEAPEEDLPAKKSKKDKKVKKDEESGVPKRPDIEDLKNKFLKKRKREVE